ncbi:hypothetical protein N7478_003302 [Penicillium angulare]|uniref:uncharacterized protein n=1 Tax=Penicillium angulare TaxID=116970 RepID=UPI0025415A2C|nr:uncharacterized protein N7478_003302 [Penicillium angulare]KAJ5287616.1 hypothetical protein N7478_003302 [Penicillium angulare]
MSTSQGDRVSLARHNYPQSPFNRAREANYEFDLDTSNFPTPSKQNGSRSHHSYRTSTLAGAYRAASRASMEEGIQSGSSPSPRQARRPFGAFSPNSETSNPRAETMDVYRGTEGYDYPPNNAPLEEWDAPRGARSASYSSSHTRNRDYEHVAHDGLAISEVSLFSENGRYSPRRRTTDYNKDEQRLRRVTGKDSPVFSKAKTGRAALTADNLQRREEEEVESQHISDGDNEHGPSLNLPTTWGSRATRRQEWLRNVSQRSVSDESKEREGGPPKVSADPSEPRTRSNDTLTSKRRSSPRSLERNRIPTRSALEERTANPHIQDIPEPREELNERKFSPDHAAPGEGDPIPNTPIVVFKNSNFTKQNQPKRDSQNLLRLLSRTESPKLEQTQTPEPPKLFERHVYDKTPRVTGAWIDTPITAKVAQIPDDLTKDIVVPSGAPKAVEAPKQQSKSQTEVGAKSKNLNKEPITITEKSPEEEKPTRPSRSSVFRPKLPKSGLETVIEDVNSGKETLGLGDDTIESLQAIVNDQIVLKTEEEEEAAYEKEVLAKLQLARWNGQGSVDIDQLDEKITSLANKIYEMKNGLAKLEGNISQSGSVTPQSSPSAEKKPQHTIRQQTSESCEQCASHPHGRVYAAIPLPQLWIRNPSTRRCQLTKLGWVTFVSLTWYVIECMMVEQYCHPTISETCDGYCLMPDAPEFPFVTVTMLWRWSHLSVILMPIFTAAMAFFRLIGLLLGLWDGYADEPTEIGNLVGEVRINGTPVAFPWLSSPSAQGLPPPQPPVWTPRDEPPPNQPPRNEAPVKWDDDQPSMDDDEFI